MTKTAALNELTLSTEQGSFQAATRHLALIDADWRQLIEQVGACTHLPKPAREPYESLIRAIAYQQLHAKAADAILTKFMALFGEKSFRLPSAFWPRISTLWQEDRDDSRDRGGLVPLSHSTYSRKRGS